MPRLLGAAACAAAFGCTDARLAWTAAGAHGTAHQPVLPCKEPVKRAPVKFPPELILGGESNVEMYSGYVNVTATDYLFYWFAQARHDAVPDAPLIVWSNGGPGCSAMEGMTTEHGPLILYGVKEDGSMFAGKLSKNPYAWNNQAHVLYVDQPRYVGYSCGTGPFVTSSIEAGRDMVTFLRGWRLLFPEHAHRSLILATESYGGHYVPAWSSAILDYNAGPGARDPLQLIGIAIGNGIVNETVQGSSFPEFASRQGLIPRNEILQSSWGAREIMKNYLGYVPNYYDYRLAQRDCCGCSSYNYKPWADWLLREDVIMALNVCGHAGKKAFGNCGAGCINLPQFDHGDNFSYSGALGRALDAGIHVTLYYGMQDTACNYVGGFAMASSVEWSGSQEFARTPLQDLLIGGVPTGKFKSRGGLTWVQVENAGHMVPINNPAAASWAIATLIRGSSAASYLSSQQFPMLSAAFEAATLHRMTRQVNMGDNIGKSMWAFELILVFLCGCLCIVFILALRACPRAIDVLVGPHGYMHPPRCRRRGVLKSGKRWYSPSHQDVELEPGSSSSSE